MELYTLDDNLRRVEVFDRFESLIWTERYSASGDFEMVTKSDYNSRKLLKPGVLVTVNDSFRVGTIEEVEDKDDSEGRSLLTVKGPSLEAVLDERATRGAGGSTSTNKPGAQDLKLTGMTPTEIVRHIFDLVCVTNTDIPSDRIPFYTPGSLYPDDDLGEPKDVIDEFVVDKMASVYSVFKQLADAYGFGFRLYRGPENSTTYFNVYMGSDRTSKQITYPAVIFSQSLDNLRDATHLTSWTNFKNVAYVFHSNASAEVYLAGVNAAKVTGFNRRVLSVDASDLKQTDVALNTALVVRGRAALAAQQVVHAIDGQLPENAAYQYGVDYNLGDLVELRNKDGFTSVMKVTEQIRTCDENGDRSYPTLATNAYLASGSWDSMPTLQTWDGSSGNWDSM